MAVRDDFAAGEVLAAADLNDTFASKLPYSYGTATPTTSDNGFLWYDSNSTPAEVKFWDGSAFQNVAPAGGLELVTTDSFSAVSSVSINGCFTSTYENYLLIVSCVASGSGQDLRWRARASGSDITTASEYLVMGVFSDGSVSARNQTLDRFTLAGLGPESMAVSMQIMEPFASTRTRTIFSTGTQASGVYRQFINAYGNRATAASHDGFSLYTSAGTITGTLRVYGYKD